MDQDPRIAAAEFLFDLLDDIDTASDMAKGNDAVYRQMVERIQARRFEVAEVYDNGSKLRFKHRASSQ